MNLEQAKFEISEVVSEIKKLLQMRDMRQFRSEVDQELYICFHEFSYPDSFESEILYDRFLRLEKLIDLCYLNELDNEKQMLLVESIIDTFSFIDRYDSTNYEENINNLNDDQIQLLNEFQAVQINMQQQIIDILNKKYLAEKTVDRSKIAKIIWKGEQKELAELFHQLKRKNWIDVKSSNAAYYKALATLFDAQGSKSLESNLKDYHRADAPVPISNTGIFNSISPNVIK